MTSEEIIEALRQQLKAQIEINENLRRAAEESSENVRNLEEIIEGISKYPLITTSQSVIFAW